jgi:hypothetical protein
VKRSLIDEFVEQVVSEAEEPKRRGDGFPKSKVKAAALLAVTADTANEVAEHVETSGYVVRNWMVEEKFKEMMARHARDFAFFLLNSREALQQLVGGGRAIGPLAERAIHEVLKSAAQSKDSEWVRNALRKVKALKAVRPRPKQKEFKKWVSDRADSALRFDIVERLKQEDAPKEPIEESLALLRHRLHMEIEKALASSDRRSRALLRDLCGCT